MPIVARLETRITRPQYSASPLAARESRRALDAPGHFRFAVPPFLAQGVAFRSDRAPRAERRSARRQPWGTGTCHGPATRPLSVLRPRAPRTRTSRCATLRRRPPGAGQDQVHRAAFTHQARQAHGAAVDQRNAPAPAIDTHVGGLLHHPDIGPQGEFHASGNRGSGNGGNHRFERSSRLGPMAAMGGSPSSGSRTGSAPRRPRGLRRVSGPIRSRRNRLRPRIRPHGRCRRCRRHGMLRRGRPR